MTYPCSGGINRLVFPKLNTVSRSGQADSEGDHRGGRRLASSLAEDHVGAVAERWPRGAQDEDRATRTHLGLDLCQEVRRCFFADDSGCLYAWVILFCDIMISILICMYIYIYRT